MDLEEGDTLWLNYNDPNDYGYEKINFCVSLVQAHELFDFDERKVNLLPSPDSIEEGVNIFNLYLKPTLVNNSKRLIDHVQDEIKEGLDANIRLNAKDCKDDQKERACEESCNNFGFKKCDPGCKFDHNLLGECKEAPYGFDKSPLSDGKRSINPCFYFQFKTLNFVNLSQHSQNIVHCKASVAFEDYDLLSRVNRTNWSKKQEEDIKFFIKEQRVFEQIISFTKTNLSSIRSLKYVVDGVKFLKKIEAETDF